MADDKHAFAVVLDQVLREVKSTLLKEHARCLGSRPVQPLSNGGDDVPYPKDQDVISAPVVSMLSDGSRQIVSKDNSSSDGSAQISPRTRGDGTVSLPLKKLLGKDQDFKLMSKYTFEISGDVQQKAMRYLGASINDQGMAHQKLEKFKMFLSAALQFPVVGIDTFMAGVILVNALTIGISSDTSDWKGWVIINLIFVLLFLFEFFAKWSFLGRSYFWGKEWGWHWFEITLLACSIIEIAIDAISSDNETFQGSALFRVSRVARLTKLLRICRLRLVTDLVLMINGVIGGARTLGWSIVMISMPLYVVALVLRETLGKENGIDVDAGTAQAMFSSLTSSYFTVFRCVVAGDCADSSGRPIFVLVCAEYGWAYGVMYGITLMLMTFGLFNVIVAIYVENTVSAAKHNESRKQEERLRDQSMFKEKTFELAMIAYTIKTGASMGDVIDGTIDLSDVYSMTLSKDEFEVICENNLFMELLSELDIAQEDQKGIFDTLDVDQGGSLDLTELMNGVGKLRGDARKSDAVAILLSVHHVSNMLSKVESTIHGVSLALETQMDAVQKTTNSLTRNLSLGATERLTSQRRDKGCGIVATEQVPSLPTQERMNRRLPLEMESPDSLQDLMNEALEQVAISFPASPTSNITAAWAVDRELTRGPI